MSVDVMFYGEQAKPDPEAEGSSMKHHQIGKTEALDQAAARVYFVKGPITT